MKLNQQYIKKILLKKSSIYAFLSLIIYKIFLELSYLFVIYPKYFYSGFTLNLNNLKLFESYLLFIFIFMPKGKEKLSNVMIWILILISFVPTLVFFAFNDESRIFMYAVTGFWLIIFLLSKLPTISISALKANQSLNILYSIFIFFLFLGFL
jgi:branched-subunit amino acid transport protein